MYEILIEDLELDIIIGILDFERKNRQKVVVNVKLTLQTLCPEKPWPGNLFPGALAQGKGRGYRGGPKMFGKSRR